MKDWRGPGDIVTDQQIGMKDCKSWDVVEVGGGEDMTEEKRVTVAFVWK